MGKLKGGYIGFYLFLKNNNIPEMICEFGDRIHFAHIRNVKVFENGDFIEASHRACGGNVNVVKQNTPLK